MQEIADEAKEILANFPESIYRQSLADLLVYTIERVK
jgi:hypothetical protein